MAEFGILGVCANPTAATCILLKSSVFLTLMLTLIVNSLANLGVIDKCQHSWINCYGRAYHIFLCDNVMIGDLRLVSIISSYNNAGNLWVSK